MKEKPDFGFLEKLEIPKKWISISANWKQKRDLNLKKVLETSIQRGIRSVVSIVCFILDFYFSLPNFGSSVQIKSSSVDSSNIKKKFQSKKVSETSAKDISEFRKRGSSVGNNILDFLFFRPNLASSVQNQVIFNRFVKFISEEDVVVVI